MAMGSATRMRCGRGAWILAGCFFSGPWHAAGLTTTNYSAERNDRFSSGYATAPVENTSENFIGAGLDWAGVGWNPSNATKSYGFLSPQHYLVARHFGGSANVRIFADQSLQTFSQSKVEDTGFGVVFSGQTLGDLSLGTLQMPVPSMVGLPRYAVLDLNSSSTSNTTSAYNNLSLLLYGRGPNASSSTRIGEATINGITVSGNNHFVTTSRTTTQLESGDSGSPAIHRWTNPAGGQEITLIGNHAAINESTNFINFTGTHQVMGALNDLMNDDGFALRVVGNPIRTWSGSNTNIGNNNAWAGGTAPSDAFVSFNGASASSRNVNVSSNANLRGLYFLPTQSDQLGFTFAGANTLTIGRGGMTNYDISGQVIEANLALGSSQYWDGGVGGVTVGNIATHGHLLEVTTVGTSRITGAITGAGSLALTSGILELNGANTYSGTTWVHGGKLIVNHHSGSATGAGEVRVAAGGTLAGAGMIGGNLSISGVLAPGNSIGTLIVDGNVMWNSGAPWEFELGSAAMTWAEAMMGISQQDLLSMTGDFIRGSGTIWTFDFMGTGQSGWYRVTTWDGTTDFQTGDFLAANLGSGLSGEFHLDEETGGLYLQVIPEPSGSLMCMVGIVLWACKRRK